MHNLSRLPGSRRLMCILVLAMGMARADTTWNGLFGSDWFTSGSWSDGVPTGADITTIDNLIGLDPVLSGNGATSNIFVGVTNPGVSLSILEGGTLGSSTGYIGFGAGSDGVVTVDDAGSQWNLKNLYLGGSSVASGGSGTLNVTSGGHVEVNQALTLWSGGELSLDGAGADDGEVTVRDFIDQGGTVDNVHGRITVVGGTFDHRLNQSFTIDSGVAGKTARWALDDLINTPTFNALTIGRGALDVTGGTRITVNGPLSLTSADGTASDLVVSGTSSHVEVNGTATVSGAVLSLSNGGSMYMDSFAYSNEAVIDFSDANVTVGFGITGTGGGDLEFVDSVVNTGSLAAGRGTFTVLGDDIRSTLITTGQLRLGTLPTPENETFRVMFSNSDIVSNSVLIGEQGVTLVFVDGGAIWEVKDMEVGLGGVADVAIGSGSSGQLSVENDLVLGASAGSRGTVRVRQVSSLLETGGDVIAGNHGTADFDLIFGGRAVIGGSLRLGVAGGGDGDVRVHQNSALAVTNELIVGENAVGYLDIEASTQGAPSVDSGSGLVGLNVGSNGEVLLTGAGARWTSQFLLSMGVRGRGTVDVLEGALMESGTSSIGLQSSGVGRVVVSGSGSTWLTTGLEVARSGDGQLTIENEGQVGSTSAEIATNSGSTGTVIVRGTTSAWTVTGNLYLGGDQFGPGGTGTLQIEDGGEVTTDLLMIHPDGHLIGDGRLIGNVLNDGFVGPGTSPGVLTVDGDFTQLPGGAIFLEIKGPNAGVDYDQLMVTGALDLTDGMVELDFTDYSSPAIGALFEFFPEQNLVGQSISVSTVGLDSGLSLNTTTFASTGRFEVVPEPSVYALALGAMALLAVSWRRRTPATCSATFGQIIRGNASLRSAVKEVAAHLGMSGQANERVLSNAQPTLPRPAITCPKSRSRRPTTVFARR